MAPNLKEQFVLNTYFFREKLQVIIHPELIQHELCLMSCLLGKAANQLEAELNKN